MPKTTPAQPDKHDGGDDDDDDDGTPKGHASGGRDTPDDDGEHPTPDAEKKNHVSEAPLGPKKVPDILPSARKVHMSLVATTSVQTAEPGHTPTVHYRSKT